MINKKITTRYLLSKYRKLSGEEKIKIAMKLSRSVRAVRTAGAKQTHTLYGI